MRRIINAALSLAAASVVLVSCGSATSTALIRLNITDAPIASDEVAAVYVAFSKVEVNVAEDGAQDEGSWVSVPADDTYEYELLSLSNGLNAALGQVELPGGSQINQIRFTVASIDLVRTADVVDGDVASAPRTAVSLASDTIKVVNAFDVPFSGDLSVTVDFDVRKSLVLASSGYVMTPVLRAVVEGEAGTITGSATAGMMVFAYPSVTGEDIAADTFSDPANSDDSPEYDDAYSSTSVGQGGDYILAFMDAGSYDLVQVDPASGTVLSVINDVVVNSGSVTTNADF